MELCVWGGWWRDMLFSTVTACCLIIMVCFTPYAYFYRNPLFLKAFHTMIERRVLRRRRSSAINKSTDADIWCDLSHLFHVPLRFLYYNYTHSLHFALLILECQPQFGNKIAMFRVCSTHFEQGYEAIKRGHKISDSPFFRLVLERRQWL